MPESISKTVPLHFVISSSLETKFATDVVVQNTVHEFKLSFFERLDPIFGGTDAERILQVESMRSSPSVCVARIAIPMSRYKAVLDVINSRWNELVKSLQPKPIETKSETKTSGNEGGRGVVVDPEAKESDGNEDSL